MADWIIESRNEITQRTGTDTRDILSDHRRTLISVTLPGGEVLDEVDVRALVGEG
jgi:hypothetical protein